MLRVAGDDRLVDLVRAGNHAAFEVLYDRHHAAILSFCRHTLGDRVEAEDAVQHTFLSGYRSLTGPGKPVALRPWLFTIARNRCISIIRARRETVSIANAEPSTDGLAVEVERRDEVLTLLRDLAVLPGDHRDALVLSELGALTHAEVAEVIGCKTDKVKSLVHQARKGLAAEREARETPCAEIQERLSVARGVELRSGLLKRHVRACPDCRAYRAEVDRQRAVLGLALPVIPAVGLKAGILGSSVALTAGGAGVGGAAVGSLAGLGGASVAAKVLTVAAVATASTAGTVATVSSVTGDDKPAQQERSVQRTGVQPQGAAGAAAAGVTKRSGDGASGAAGAILPTQAARRSAAGSANGLTPTTGAGSNGAAAQDFARTRANGKKVGLERRAGTTGKTKRSRARSGNGSAGSRSMVTNKDKAKARDKAKAKDKDKDKDKTRGKSNLAPGKAKTPRARSNAKAQAAPKPKLVQAQPVEPPPSSASGEAGEPLRFRAAG